MIPDYTHTPPDSDYWREPRRSELDAWARAWTEQIARASGGLTYSAQCHVFLALHEIRKRVAVGDYGPPNKRESAQMDLLK